MLNPCSEHPEWFVYPEDRKHWDRTPEAEQARNICATCPLVAACARAALDHHVIPADQVIAGIACRGNADTLYRLRQRAGMRTRGHLSLVPPLDPDELVCLECQEPAVKVGQKRPDGYVVIAARGLCRTCYSAAYRTGALDAPREPRTDHCIDCELPMVPAHHDIPAGHVRHDSNNRCDLCARQYRKAAAA